MKSLAIIPARGGSKGIPRKNLRIICGKPLIAWNIEAASGADSISLVYVSTDDAEIAEVSRACGAKVIMRPPEISGDKASSEAALLHALHTIESETLQLPESFVFLQCTSPLTTSTDIDGAVGELDASGADSAFSATRFHHFLWRQTASGQMEGINHQKNIRLMRQQREEEWIENGAIYVMRTKGFQESQHRFFGKTIAYQMASERCWEIDDPIDFEIAEVLLRNRLQKDKLALIPNTIEAVVFDFDGVLTDDRILQQEDGSEAVYCLRGDGMGIRMLREAGIRVLILSSEENPVVRARAKKLKVEVIHGSLQKGPLLQEWATTNKIDLSKSIYVGNDINDIAPMSLVGCPLVVADAHPSVKKHALFILDKRGGHGAAREVADYVLTKSTSTPVAS